MVFDHSEAIKELAIAATGRKRLLPDNRDNRNNSAKAIAEAREEAIAELIAWGTLRAYELALTTTGDFDRHLRFVLSREFRRGNARSTNPLDHAKVFLDSQSPKNKTKPHMDEPDIAGDEFIDEITTEDVVSVGRTDSDEDGAGAVAVPSTEIKAVPSTAIEPVGLPESLETRINRVLEKPYRAVARLRFGKRLSIEEIAEKTGRKVHWLKRYLPRIEQRLDEEGGAHPT